MVHRQRSSTIAHSLAQTICSQYSQQNDPRTSGIPKHYAGVMSKRGPSSNDSSESRSQSPSNPYATKSRTSGSRKRTHVESGPTALSSTNYTSSDPSAASNAGFRSSASRFDIHDNALPSTITLPELQSLASRPQLPLTMPDLLPEGVAGVPPVDQQYAASDTSLGSDFGTPQLSQTRHRRVNTAILECAMNAMH